MSNLSTRIKILVIIIIVAIVGLVSLTLAYFALNTYGNPTEDTIFSDAASLELTFSDEEETISLSNAIPGDSDVKTITVTNTGSVNAFYALYFDQLINTYTVSADDQLRDSEMLFSLICKEYHLDNSGNVINGGDGQPEEHACTSFAPIRDRELDYTAPLQNGDLPNPVVQEISDSIKIEPNARHVYYLTVRFISKNSSQNYNLQAHLSGAIKIRESARPKTMLGIYAYNGDLNTPLSHTVVSLGNNLTGVTGSDGYIEFTSLDECFEENETCYRIKIGNDTNNLLHNNPIRIKKSSEVAITTTSITLGGVPTTVDYLTFVNSLDRIRMNIVLHPGETPSYVYSSTTDVRVTYNCYQNAGLCDYPVERTTYNTTVDLSTKVATKAGSSFVGWNTDPNASVGLPNITASNDITLYAIFSTP